MKHKGERNFKSLSPISNKKGHVSVDVSPTNFRTPAEMLTEHRGLPEIKPNLMINTVDLSKQIKINGLARKKGMLRECSLSLVTITF